MGEPRLVPDGCRRVVTALPAHGEVWWCELGEIGRRPVVVLSRDAAIPRLRRTLIGPCTTTIRGIPSEVLLEPSEDPIPLTSVVNMLCQPVPYTWIQVGNNVYVTGTIDSVMSVSTLSSAPPHRLQSETPAASAYAL